jgi:hypothetical protein
VLIHQALCSVYKVLETSSSGCYKVAANDVWNRKKWREEMILTRFTWNCKIFTGTLKATNCSLKSYPFLQNNF